MKGRVDKSMGIVTLIAEVLAKRKPLKVSIAGIETDQIPL
jgi:hypothetical protein